MDRHASHKGVSCARLYLATSFFEHTASHKKDPCSICAPYVGNSIALYKLIKYILGAHEAGPFCACPMSQLYGLWKSETESNGAFDQFVVMYVSQTAMCTGMLAQELTPYFEWQCFTSAKEQQNYRVSELDAKLVCKDQTIKCSRCGSHAISKQLVQDRVASHSCNPSCRRRTAERTPYLHELSQNTIHSVLTTSLFMKHCASQNFSNQDIVLARDNCVGIAMLCMVSGHPDDHSP